MSKHRDPQSGGGEIPAPQPDDPIFAAFGLDPEEAEMARSLARPPRRLWRGAVIAGLAVMVLAAGSLFLRPAHMAAHAETAGTPAAVATKPAPATPANAFNSAMTQAMMSMHGAMDVPYSGNPDRDFARMMIPHHQGAIDMARLELQYGKDPRLRRLAEEIIVTQQQEIAVMQLVLKDLAGGRAPDAGMNMNGTHMNGMQMDGTRPSGGPAPATAP